MNSIKRKISKIIPANLKHPNNNFSKNMTRKSLLSFYEINFLDRKYNNENNIARTNSIKLKNALKRKGKSYDNISSINSLKNLEISKSKINELIIKNTPSMNTTAKLFNNEKLIEATRHNVNGKKKSIINDSETDIQNYFFPNKIKYNDIILKNLSMDVKSFFEISVSKIKKFKKKFTNNLNQKEAKENCESILSLTIKIIEELSQIIPSIEDELQKLSGLLKQIAIKKKDHFKFLNSFCLSKNLNVKQYFNIPKDDFPLVLPQVNDIKIDLKRNSNNQEKKQINTEFIESISGTNYPISTATQTIKEHFSQFNLKNNDFTFLNKEENLCQISNIEKFNVKRKGTDISIPKLSLNKIKVKSPDFNEEFLSNLNQFSDSWRKLSNKLKK